MAIKNNSVEIIIDAVTKKPSSESGEKSAAVILSGDTLKDIAEKTDADIVIQTNVAKIRLNADGTYTFITGYFSQYALMAAKDANTAIQAQKAEVKALKLTLRSRQVQTLSGKKAVKLTWTDAKNTEPDMKSGKDIKLDGIEIYRSLKKNTGYGKKPFFTTTKATYCNTAVKTGTRYYYKVRGFVTIDGEKVYTHYSTKAW